MTPAFCHDTQIAIEISSMAGFNNITALSFSLHWDENVIDFVSLGDFNLQHLDIGDFDITQVPTGLITFAWIDDDGSGVTLPDGDSIFTIVFNVVGDPSDETPIEITDMPTSIVAGQGFPPTSIPVNVVSNGNAVIVDDPPVFDTCPSDISENNDAGVCGAIITWAVPTASDVCDDPDPNLFPVIMQTEGLAPGSLFPVGKDTVVYIVTDSKGQKDTCSFTVTVTDNEPPIITCPMAVAVGTNTDCTATGVALGTATATDNCSTTKRDTGHSQ